MTTPSTLVKRTTCSTGTPSEPVTAFERDVTV